jgi:hypothetical protein
MEAAAVARAAEARRVLFAVVKVISDEFDFTLPDMDRFVDSDGRFLESRFGLFAAIRPWIWPQVVRLATNSKRASRVLCEWLESVNIAQVSSSSNTSAIEAAHRR